MFVGKPILVSFPVMTGGKFLINCLGISDQCTLPDADLLLKQLDNKLTKRDKLSILLDKLTNVSSSWNDLEFSFGTLLRFTCSIEHVNYYSGFTYKDSFLNKEMFDISPYKDTIINSGKYYCRESHGINDTLSFYDTFDNVKIILFKDNYNNFLDFRCISYLKTVAEKWDILRGHDWPVNPPASIQELDQLPAYIKKELSDIISSKGAWNFDWEVEKLLKTNYLTWDADDYLDKDAFLSSLEKLYHALELTDFDPDIILPYYNSWISKLEELINNINN